MSNYTFSNQAAVPPAILQPLLKYFTSWDDPDTDHSYLDAFHPNVVLYFAATTCTGQEEIKKMRTSQVHPKNGPIVDLGHALDKIFLLAGSDTTSGGSQQVFMNGTIWFKIANGKRIDEHWATWMDLVPDAEGAYKIQTCRIYEDTLALTTAIAEMMKSNGVAAS